MKRFNGRVLELAAMMGSYVWLEEKLPEENSGTITFEVSDWQLQQLVCLIKRQIHAFCLHYSLN